MNKTFKQLIEDGKNINLTDAERGQIWSKLESRIAEPAVMKWTHQLRTLMFFELKAEHSVISVALALVILVGGGASYAASGALPGEALYPIKINFNERVQELTALSPESQAELKVNLAARRLEEGEILAAENKLTPELADEVSSNFERYARKAEQNIASLKAKGATSSLSAVVAQNSNLEANLKAHETLLQKLEDNYDGDNAVARLNESVRTKLVEVKQKRAVEDKNEFTIASSTLGMKMAAEGKSRAAGNKLDEATNFIDTKITSLNGSVREDVTEKLQTAKNTYAEAAVSLEETDYPKAFEKYQESMRIAEEAKVLVQAGEPLKIMDRIAVRAAKIASTTGTTTPTFNASRAAKENLNVIKRPINSKTPDNFKTEESPRPAGQLRTINGDKSGIEIESDGSRVGI